MKKTLTYLFIEVLLIVFSSLIHSSFTKFTLSQLKFENVNFVSSLNNNDILFAFSFAILPLLHLLVDRIIKIKSLKQSLIIIGVIFLSGVVFWQIRVYNLSVKLKLLSEYLFVNDINGGYDMAGFKFELYLILGFICGSIITIIIYKLLKKSQ